MYHHINHIIKRNLSHQSGEQIGLIWSKEYEEIAQKVKDYCAQEGIQLNEVPILEGRAKPISRGLEECFLGDQPQILVLAGRMENGTNLWHLKVRREAKYAKGKRLINLIHPNSLVDSIYANPSEMEKIASLIHARLIDAQTITVCSKAGTELEARINNVQDKSIFKEFGDYSLSGSGGDMPAGEVGFFPLPESVRGRIVYDLKIQHVGLVKHCPHIVEVNADRVKVLEGSSSFERLININPLLRYISEISIGINPYFIETEDKESIVEEKNKGTMHFGHGADGAEGLRKGPHFDCVILKPTLFIGKEKILEEGNLVL